MKDVRIMRAFAVCGAIVLSNAVFATPAASAPSGQMNTAGSAVAQASPATTAFKAGG